MNRSSKGQSRKRAALNKLLAERRLGADGVEMQTLLVARSKPFAAKCLAIWSEMDGRDHTYKLAFRAIDVPVNVIDATRERLAKERASESLGSKEVAE